MTGEGSPATEQHKPPATFFHPENDAALLRAITLDADAITPEWVGVLNDYIATGSQVINIHVTQRTSQAIGEARSSAVKMVGLNQPAHPLHDAFLTIHADLKYINPRLFGALKSLAPIGNPVEMICKVPRLWLLSGKAIERRMTYMGRLATVLGWQGDQREACSATPSATIEHIRALVRECPEILLYREAKLGALARIAAEFGEDRHRFLPQKVVAQYSTGKILEAHIAGIVHRKDYEFGMRSSGKGPGKLLHSSKLQSELYEGISDPVYIARVGRPVLWAYFRANPPSAEARLRFPAVRAFVPKGSCRGDGLLEVTTLALPSFVTGKEQWLEEMRILPRSRKPMPSAKRKRLLATLNWHIAHGSYPLGDIPAEKGISPVYELVARHRLAFFVMLGWTDPKHVLYDRLKEFHQKRHALVAPRRVVHILNALSLRGVQPVIPVLESFFGILEFLPESLHKKLDVYEAAGEDINTRLQRGATPLRMSVDSLAARLATEVEKRKERVAKGFKPKALGPGARRRKS